MGPALAVASLASGAFSLHHKKRKRAEDHSASTNPNTWAAAEGRAHCSTIELLQRGAFQHRPSNSGNRISVPQQGGGAAANPNAQARGASHPA